MIRPHPNSTLFPYTTLFRSAASIWAYHDFGAVAAVTTAIMLATTPPLLAHAGLATTDVPVAAMTVPSLFAFRLDRKSTRLNSSHRCISYAVFCLKKKKKNTI